MADRAVVIAGGGPTGMMLAAELTIAGVDVVIVEPRADRAIESSRSGGLHARTIEVLDQRGVADRFLAEGEAMQVQGYAGIPLDISDFPSRHNYGLALWQSRFERIMAAWVDELGVAILSERMVTGFTQDAEGVDVELSDDSSVRASYLVGCDGSRSAVRKAAGIEYPGSEPTTTWLIAEVQATQTPPPGTFRRERGGAQAIGPADGGRFRVVLTEPALRDPNAPTLQELKDALIVVFGTDFGVHSPTWIACFTDMTRQAATYRVGRVLLAGDAAHVHPPQGGQGMNLGLQDAVNLGWKLAQVVKGTSPDELLDTYHAERHPVGARVIKNTMAQVALSATDERSEALREAITELLRMDEPRKHIAGMISGLDIHYDLGDGHPLLGRRMPDLDLVTDDGPIRLFTLLHDARPNLLNLGKRGGYESVARWGRVKVVDANYDGRWELPVLGAVSAPLAVLVRPDGHVAWVEGPDGPGLDEALAKWFGQP